MAKIHDIYQAVDDFGLITSAEARQLGMSNAELVQQAHMGKLERVAQGVYRMPVWPFQEQAPYAIVVKAAGEGAFLYGESVVALLKLAPTNPAKMWVASPRRVRRRIGEGVRLVHAVGVQPVYFDGVACQPLCEAIISAAATMGTARAIEAAQAAQIQGFITADEFEQLREGLR